MAILKGLKYELMLKLLDISEIKDSTLSASNSKIVIWKTKHFFSTFYRIFGMHIKFGKIWKK